MIVKNKALAIENASVLADQAFKFIFDEINNLDIPDDAAEYIYLLIHTTANFVYRMCFGLQEYGKASAIEKLNFNEIKKWIVTIIDEQYEAINNEKHA